MVTKHFMNLLMVKFKYNWPWKSQMNERVDSICSIVCFDVRIYYLRMQRYWLFVFLPSATKLRRLCFYTCLWFCSQGEYYPSMHCRRYPSMPCSRGGCLLPGGGACSRGVTAPGWSAPRGVSSRGGCLLRGGAGGVVETKPENWYWT